MAEDETNATQAEETSRIIRPLKIYLKDVSFETPNSPSIFTVKWQPSLEIEFQNSARQLDPDQYEVVVTVTVTTSVAGETAYLAEVHQAGIFEMSGFDAEMLHMTQNTYCIRILYPYASAALSDLVSKGGFPQLVLSPMNFERLYRDRINKLKESRAETGNA